MMGVFFMLIYIIEKKLKPKMDLDKFRHTSVFRRFKYQRCVYLIRPKHDDALFGNSACRWLKVGIARTNLWNRLRSYRTYWPSGVQVLACATVGQPGSFEGEAIAVVERHVLFRARRLRPGVESLRHDQATAVISAMRSHKFTIEVWTADTDNTSDTDTDTDTDTEDDSDLQIAEPLPVTSSDPSYPH